VRARFCSVANCARKSVRRRVSRAAPGSLGSGSAVAAVVGAGVGLGGVVVFVLAVFVFGARRLGLREGSVFDAGEADRGSCSCAEGVVGSGISAGFVDAGAVAGAVAEVGGTEPAFASANMGMGRKGKTGMGIVSVIQWSAPGPSLGLWGAVGVFGFARDGPPSPSAAVDCGGVSPAAAASG
jgi:hypothetical protein